MPVYPENVTPAQTRHFRVEIDGFNPFAVQSVGVPSVEHDSVEVSNGQGMVKFPGLTKTGDLVIKGFIDAMAPDDARLSWFFINGNPELGIAAAPYAKVDGAIIRTDAAGAEVQRWVVRGAWAKEVDGYSFDKAKSALTRGRKGEGDLAHDRPHDRPAQAPARCVLRRPR